MTQNNNLSPLAFYSSLSEQNHRIPYAFGERFSVASPVDVIPTFQATVSFSFNIVTNVTIYKLDGSFSQDITSEMTSAGLAVKTYTDQGIKLLVYGSTASILSSYDEGVYYLTISDGTLTYYSDSFRFIQDMRNYTMIEYNCYADLIQPRFVVDFSNNFRFRVYVDAQVGLPSYPFEEEVENLDGHQMVVRQISKKLYKFNFVATEYLCDALRIVRMCDRIFITNMGNNYLVERFLMTPSWEDGGFYASVNVEFETDTIIKKIGKAYSTVPSSGDFNDDFNNDFNND